MFLNGSTDQPEGMRFLHLWDETVIEMDEETQHTMRIMQEFVFVHAQIKVPDVHLAIRNTKTYDHSFCITLEDIIDNRGVT